MRALFKAKICITFMFMSILATDLSVQAENNVAKPESLAVSLLQSSSDPDYVKPLSSMVYPNIDIYRSSETDGYRFRMNSLKEPFSLWEQKLWRDF
jgi:hypothetical protein